MVFTADPATEERFGPRYGSSGTSERYAGQGEREKNRFPVRVRPPLWLHPGTGTTSARGG